MELVVATKNKGKVAEITGLLAEFRVKILSLDSFPAISEVAETGNTFAENAALKASGYAKQTGSYALADDSGLEIDALDGEPGVFSARYGGEYLNYTDKMALVLSKLIEVPEGGRQARFVCAMAIADPKGEILHTAKGICDGSIAFEGRGTNGFGYDPIFIPNGFAETFGEQNDDIKQQISHRARAISEIMRFLLDFMRV